MCAAALLYSLPSALVSRLHVEDQLRRQLGHTPSAEEVAAYYAQRFPPRPDSPIRRLYEKETA